MLERHIFKTILQSIDDVSEKYQFYPNSDQIRQEIEVHISKAIDLVVAKYGRKQITINNRICDLNSMRFLMDPDDHSALRVTFDEYQPARHININCVVDCTPILKQDVEIQQLIP
jgi:hypothetical protein